MIRKEESTSHYLKVSKIAGVFFTLAAIGTALLVTTAKDGMFLFAAGILATIMPPFGAIAVLGAVWKRASPRGALLGLVFGMGGAVILFGIDRTGALSSWAQDTLYIRSGIVFLISLTITVLFSLFDDYMDNLQPIDREGPVPTGLENPKNLGIILLLAILAMYVLFTVL